MWCVVLQAKGTTRNALITAQEGAPSAESIGTILRRATPPQLIGTWTWTGYTLFLFAYKTGKAGTENKHELPPPHDTILLFGDAVLLATENGSTVSFGTTEYTKFYNESFGGFEDLGSEDSEDDEEDDDEAEDEEEEEVDDEEIPVDNEFEEAEDEVAVPVKTVKVKRGGKKINNYYTYEPLKPEAYTLTT